jgi:segregation and condensation protein B
MLNSKIESILFVSGKPLEIKVLAKIVGRSKEEVEVALDDLKNKYNNEESGIHILTVDGKVQLVTNPKNKEMIGELIKEEVNSELTRPQLETLTIAAYRGPITKLELEQIRGVNCTLILRNLMIKGLVEEEEDKIAKVEKYRITMDFMKHLGITEIEQLPDYDKLSKSEILEEILGDEAKREKI